MSVQTLTSTRSLGRIYALEARYELLKLIRLPAYVVPTLAFPLVFYLLFGVALRRAAAAWEEADPLTDRERQVLRLAAEGLSTAKIGAEIHLSEGTVRNHLSEAISKLGAENRVDAARIARQKGWL